MAIEILYTGVIANQTPAGGPTMTLYPAGIVPDLTEEEKLTYDRTIVQGAIQDWLNQNGLDRRSVEVSREYFADRLEVTITPR